MRGCLVICGSSGPTIASNPNDPLNLAYASLHELRVSTDGGASWQPPVAALYPREYGPTSFPSQSSLAFDSQGRLFWAYKAIPRVEGVIDEAWIQMDILFSQCDPATGEVLAGYPINMTEAAGIPAGTAHHNANQSMGIDAPPTALRSASPFQDRIYIGWTPDTGQLRSNNFISYSTDQGLTWSNRLSVSGPDWAEGDKYPMDLTVAPNGDVFVAYHSDLGNGNTDGLVYVTRSTDGGVTFPQKTAACDSGEADISWNLEAHPAVPGVRFALIGSAQPWILADPVTSGRIYVIFSDDPDDTEMGDFADVMMVTSTDHGASWSDPIRIDSGPGESLQLMPTASIGALDDSTSLIAVHYYDNRSGEVTSSGDYLLDVYATTSTDGGETFCCDAFVSDTSVDAALKPPFHGGTVCWWACANRFRGVWCTSANNVFVVGRSDDIDIIRWNGTSWLSEDDTTGFLHAICGRSASDIFAVGADGRVLHFDGASWSTQTSGTFNDLRGVWCGPVGETIAVGDYGTIRHYDGVSWSTKASGTAVALTDVWGSAGGDVFAVGQAGTILFYDGVSWSTLVSAADSLETLHGVWGASSNDVWAVGEAGTVRHFDGTTWSLEFHPGILRYSAVRGSNASSVYAVGLGRDRTGRVAKYDGSTWSQVGAATQELHAVWSDADDVFVAGWNGSILSSADGGSTWIEHDDNPGASTSDALRIFSGWRNGLSVAGGNIHVVWGGNNLESGSPVSHQSVVSTFSPPDSCPPAPCGATAAPVPGESMGPAMTLSTGIPNPFGPLTHVSFALRTSGHARLSLYDVRGRLVTTLVDRWLPAGPHTAQWNGRNGAGQAAASGVYFVRLESAGQAQTSRIVRRQ